MTIRKIILVKGPQNSGKSSSIKAAAKLLGVNLTGPVGDLTMIARLRIGRSNRDVAFAGGGDTVEVIRGNIAFLGCHDLECAVMACSTMKRGLPIIESLASVNNATLVCVETQQVSPSTITAHTDRVAREIVSHIN